ncbi:MauE/DoxX family redox-associated membrane protein [Allostreptomyces psammosilenae]|uniref:Methylamine utilisation protein MauE domain-containing protein n=1 Tax=Allostreptomyces psammosilenae TaxID=1892865 RepID=A0A852ZVP1_9ACTN|nr:MauE/DoxX family redox-associated membrane protein [Allostreptomyces psammosilenae]NYI06446.1 hypothetical protein [Allostreptomyces psammosilenae]
MVSLTVSMIPLLLGAVLCWSGAPKLFDRAAERRVAGTAVERMLGTGRAVPALRAVGAAELAVAAGLLVAPGPLSGAAATLLGTGFVGYLGHARATVPESSCGCTARDDAPIGTRAFLRAGAVVAAGVAATAAGTPWWQAGVDRPAAALGVLLAGAAVAALLFTETDRWLLPLRRWRLRTFGSPLERDGVEAPVPVQASVELLERSLAWEAASGAVRSGLLDSWDEDGWRFLQYAGQATGPAAGQATERSPGDATGRSPGQEGRPVWVLFALDARATLDTVGRPAVRVTVIDQDSGEVLPGALADVSTRTPLPLVS